MNNEEWFDLVCGSYTAPPVEFRGRSLPAFPPDELQRNTTGRCGVSTLEEAFDFYVSCLEACESAGRPVDSATRILDFGAGWGRVTRFFLRECPLEQIFGVDVDENSAALCRQLFASRNFVACNAMPPCDLADGSMDLVVGYSVFSHLSEASCSAWMEEFSRLLTPGGIVAVTTRSRDFLSYCETMKSTATSSYEMALSNMFEDFDEARRRYDSGQFLHSSAQGVSGGGAMSSDFYGETFIPEAYARSAYSRWFDFQRFIYRPGQLQPILLFTKSD